MPCSCNVHDKCLLRLKTSFLNPDLNCERRFQPKFFLKNSNAPVEVVSQVACFQWQGFKACLVELWKEVVVSCHWGGTSFLSSWKTPVAGNPVQSSASKLCPEMESRSISEEFSPPPAPPARPPRA